MLCVLIVEGMSVVVNVMLSLMSVMSPPLALRFGFRGELGFLNCDDFSMCVVNKQFELLEFIFESVYVDLQYDEIYLTFTAGPVCLCGVSSPVVVLGLFMGCRSTLCCACGCCGDCDACTVVCVAWVCVVRV